jgi:hypothetical protein
MENVVCSLTLAERLLAIDGTPDGRFFHVWTVTDVDPAT